MKLLISLSVITMFLTLFSAGIIKGNVVNADTQPMPEANITVVGTGHGSATNEAGYYIIKNIPEGRYNLKCSYIGHKDEIISGVPVINDSVLVVDFLLFPIEYQMAEIEVQQDKEDINSLLYFRDLAQMELIYEHNVPYPKLNGKIDVKTKPGFWEMFRYYIYRIFH